MPDPAAASPVRDPALSYICCVVRDLPAIAAILEREFGLARSEGRGPDGAAHPMLRVGATALVLAAGGDALVGADAPTGVHHLAFAAERPEEMAATLGLPRDPTRAGLDGAPSVALDPAATCGVRVRLTPPPARPEAAPGPVRRIDHIGIASADNDAARAVFSGRFGCVYESGQTDLETVLRLESFTSDRYGVVQHARPARIAGGLVSVFLTAGDCELEFLQEFDPATGLPRRDGPGSTEQDQGAIGRHIARRGAGLHHLALKVADIDGLLGSLAAAGLPLVDGRGRPGGRASRIGFLHPAALGGMLLHLVERPGA